MKLLFTFALLSSLLLLLLPSTDGITEQRCLSAYTCLQENRGVPQDDNLRKILNLDLPFKDTTWFLNEFKRLKSNGSITKFSTASEKSALSGILRLGNFLGWDSVLSIPNVEEIIREAEIEGEQNFLKLENLKQLIQKMGIVVSKDDPAYKHSSAFVRTDVISTKNSAVGFMLEEHTKVFMERSNLSTKASSGLGLLGDTEKCRSQFLKKLVAPFQLLPGIFGIDQKVDSEVGACDPHRPYRTMDGSCNNLQDPLKGAAFRRFNRVLLPAYYEGVSHLRRDENGHPLPSARLISTTINTMKVSPENSDLSAFHMTYGQFLDHDITRTPVIKVLQTENGTITNDGLPIRCCDQRLKEMAENLEDLGCAPIDIPKNDPFYSRFDQTCMEFVRSTPAPRCSLGPREQVNEQSAYLDGSQIYGVKPTSRGHDPLRANVDGRLKNHLTKEGFELLSLSKNMNDGCNVPKNAAKGKFCFKAGDGRVNEILTLTFFQVLWAREHNRVAKILKDLRPGAKDEELYQESRRIIIAQLQHITFNEFLPSVIPFSILAAQGMLPKTGRTQTTLYNPTADATIINSFSTAAYRFGHSEIRDSIRSMKKSGKLVEDELSSFFFNPFQLYDRSSMGDIARGGTSSNSKMVDQFFTQEVAGKLFRGPSGFGLDLLALNIQRGRDHGLPGYTKWLAKCGFPNINKFEDLSRVMSKNTIAALESVYKSVHDIDLYPGGISETHLEGGILGPTFTCLLTDQFKRMKSGDRFWYEERGQAGSFTQDQMQQLHQVSLARVLCNNIPELKRIQRFPLLEPGPKNPILPCDCHGSLIPNYDLTPWRMT
ncbi:peroxidase-like [Macrobrachium rosenbergii]|uniref:peroxidase-like n=1 Tax=Macrobrachium rosenbergii TaxID=79674 RepID=UPI0034D500DB